MADSSAPTPMDFCTFVRDLKQTTDIDYGSSGGGGGGRNCCPADSRLSQEFEHKMQQLLSNFDLGDQRNVPMAAGPEIAAACVVESLEADHPVNDSAFPVDKSSHSESLETTLDNEDDPLELTDSEDAGDGASSDEQQQSRSLSLSYSLSISHAQENFSQYSQSTDKGLSKHYDSPCSYEDDRESECTNFDKLDDWNDFIADMQNNNNNGDPASRDFREYYDEYLVSKGVKGSDDGESSTDGCNIKVNSNSENTATDKDTSSNSVEDEKDNRSTPAVSADRSSMNKSTAFLEYRNPSLDMEDDPMECNLSGRIGTPIERVLSGKRKFCFDDPDDIEHEVSEVITEKFRKTDVVPFHGCHDPISHIDDELFAQMVRIEFSSSKTPIPQENSEYRTHSTEFSIYDKRVDDEGNLDEGESNIATTPTNAKNLEQMFQTFENAPHNSSVKNVSNQRLQHKVLPQNSAIELSSSHFHHFDRSHLTIGVESKGD